MSTKNVSGLEWLAAHLMIQVILGLVMVLLSFFIFRGIYEIISTRTIPYFGLPILLIPFVFHLGYAYDAIQSSIKSKKKEKK